MAVTAAVGWKLHFRLMAWAACHLGMMNLLLNGFTIASLQYYF